LSWTRGIDVWKILTDLGRVLLWGLGKVFEVFNWGRQIFIQAGGEPAGLLYIVILVVFIPLVIILHTTSGTQASIENFQKLVASTALKLIIVGLIIFVILFVLSGG